MNGAECVETKLKYNISMIRSDYCEDVFISKQRGIPNYEGARSAKRVSTDTSIHSYTLKISSTLLPNSKVAAVAEDVSDEYSIIVGKVIVKFIISAHVFNQMTTRSGT